MEISSFIAIVNILFTLLFILYRVVATGAGITPESAINVNELKKALLDTGLFAIK